MVKGSSLVAWVVGLIVICLLVMGSLTWIVHNRLRSKPTRVRSPKKVEFGLSAQEHSTFHNKSLKLEDNPLYLKIVQKLQALDHEIGTLPLHSARRRFLEGQRWFYAIVRMRAQLVDRVRTKPAPSNSSSNHQWTAGEIYKITRKTLWTRKLFAKLWGWNLFIKHCSIRW